MIKYKDFIFEYKKEDIDLLDGLDNYFTVGFEIELNSSKIKESWPLYPSRKNKLILSKFEKDFPNFYKKYKDRISLHAEETVPEGIEVVNSTFAMETYPETTAAPFHNLNESVQYIKDFFIDFNNQRHWVFDKSTSIHINIGINEEKYWNIVKGIMMLSDEFSFKGIEDRRTSHFCRSLKDRLYTFLKGYFRNPHHYWKKEILLEPYETNIQKIEQGIMKILLKRSSIANKGMAKNFGMNLSNIIRGTHKYIEFRHIGGKNISEKIILDKLKYYSYIVYLMTSDHRNKEYVRKLFSFLNKCRENN